ncbi:MAG: serine/threonine protein kinase [Deltaproteobacteria bacterium]|nr:MAG: serine/threonine protein kinase [Deltaproteobacteria bacterium]
MADRYRPLFKLDSGGMAEVYVAEAESLGGFKKKVAIKRILPSLHKDERFVRMFLDEARLSLYLNHANIVSVFDIGKSDNTYFIVMEYVDGTNLKAVIEDTSRRGERLPLPLTLWTLNEVLKGLDYAHNLVDPQDGRPLGIVHRDISPPNILISWNGEVKLTDFGLAKATTQLESTDPGVVKGKFSYLSPEAVQGREVDHRADIFAVGILAWEMLAGRRLFMGETDYQTVELVRRAEVPPLAQFNPEVTPELERIVQRALAREPSDRYQSASEFADDLLGYLFSRALKFSSRDLSGYLERLRRQAPKPQAMAGPANMILELIQDELLNFRSLDDESPAGGAEAGAAFDGAQPLSVEDFATKSSEHKATIMLQPGEAPVPAAAPSPPPPGADAAVARAHEESGGEATGRRDVPLPPNVVLASPAPARPGPNPLVWIVVLLLLLAGGGAAYWFVVLGHPLPAL